MASPVRRARKITAECAMRSPASRIAQLRVRVARPGGRYVAWRIAAMQRTSDQRALVITCRSVRDLFRRLATTFADYI